MATRHPHLALLAPLLAVFALVASANPMPGTVHGDGYYTYLWARTLVYDGDLEFHEDYRVCPDPWGLKDAPVAADVNYWNLGPALFWVPILAWQKWTGAGEGRVRQEAEACTGPLAERSVFGSLLAGLLAAWLGLLVGRRHVGGRAAWAGAFVGALTTPLVYYATTMLSYGHAASAFGCGLALWAWDRWRDPGAHDERPWRAWSVMGLALGLAMLMRSQNAVMVVLPLATWLGAAWRNRGEARAVGWHVLHGFAFLGCLTIVFLPQMIYWWKLTGSPFAISQGEHYIRWGAPRIGRALFSTGNGLFPWSPIFYPAFAGWVILARRKPTRALGIGCLALFAIDSYVVGAVYDWWGSIGYPGRRFDMLFVPAMVGLAATIGALGEIAWRRRGVAVVFTGIFMALIPFTFGVNDAIARGMRIDTAGPAPQKWAWVSGRLGEGVWKLVGNPLAWPASIPFAIRWGVHPRDWDVLGSQELFYHDHQTLERRRMESTLRAGLEENDGYFGGSFDEKPSRVAGRPVRVAREGSARILVPLHWPDLGGVIVRGRPVGAESAVLGLRVNGIPCGVERLLRGGEVHFQVPPGMTDHGINELWLHVDGAAVAVENLELLDPDPPPSVEQARRNEALRNSR